jgi:hypothetical protein
MQVTGTIPDTMIAYTATDHVKTFNITVIRQAF